MAFFSVPRPDEIFTPKDAKVNDRSYVHRPDLENQLVRAIRGSKHFCIFGESGNGKSWLYKKVFAQYRVPYRTINLSMAQTRGSLMNAIQDKVASISVEETISVTSTSSGGVNPGGVGLTYEKATVVHKMSTDPVESLFRLIRGTQARPSVLVLDNFEIVSDSKSIISEISSLVMLLDDDDYAKYYVKLCIVGVPAEIREYIAQQENRTSIFNRLSELSEVSRLNLSEAEEILYRGFEEHLKLSFKNAVERVNCYERLLSVSDRVASEVQDLGLEVAQLAVKNDRVIEALIVEDAISDWIRRSHNGALVTIMERMNKSTSRSGRRSQCLFCLGRVVTEDFRIADIENLLKIHFPNSTNGTSIDVRRHLVDLAKGANPPIRKLSVGDGYRFSHPKYKMAIRSALVLREDEHVDVRRAKI